MGIPGETPRRLAGLITRKTLTVPGLRVHLHPFHHRLRLLLVMQIRIASWDRLRRTGRRCRALTLVTLAVSFFVLTITPGSAQVFVRVAPPAPIVEPGPPPPPGPGYVWVAGHWHWNGERWVWRHGHYVLRPRHYGAWVPPHYDRRDGGWVYVPGHWR
jgi:hypothetical protein